MAELRLIGIRWIVLVLAGSAGAVGAQVRTEQWSQPSTTGKWSQPSTTEKWSEPSTSRASPPRESPSGTAGTQVWSSPAYTEQVDPASMEDPAVVRGGGPAEAALAGDWNLWVPGGIWYSSDGSRVFRHYTPGADLNLLSIRPDGSYRWAGHNGRLVEVRPWFAQAGQRYYAVQMGNGNRYMARYDADQGKLNLFFWGVGGHAASGTRGR